MEYCILDFTPLGFWNLSLLENRGERFRMQIGTGLPGDGDAARFRRVLEVAMASRL
jgi:hypothetical protein